MLLQNKSVSQFHWHWFLLPDQLEDRAEEDDDGFFAKQNS